MQPHIHKNPSTFRDSAITELRTARLYLDLPQAAVTRDHQLLWIAQTLFDLVDAAEKAPTMEDASAIRVLRDEVRSRMHADLRLSWLEVPEGLLIRRLRKLEPIEVDLILLMVLFSTGVKVLGLSGMGVDDLSRVLIRTGHPPGEILRVLYPNGRLVREGFIHVHETEPWIHSSISPARELLESIARPDRDEPWKCGCLDDFLQHLAEFGRIMHFIAACMEDDDLDFPVPSLWQRSRILRQARATLEAHREWALTAFLDADDSHLMLLLVLVCKDYGHIPFDSPLDSGRGLMWSLSTAGGDVPKCTALLGSGSMLRSDGWLRPALGPASGAQAEESEDALAETVWELSEEARTHFGLPLRRRPGSRRTRQPSVRIENLVLHDDAREAISMTLAQVQNGRQIFEDWGLGEVMSYGRGATLLFSGPSGVGKTAAAEGIATALARPLLEVEASQVLECLIGESEKNLVRIFREAAQANAVLFFDEADAFFYDRSMAQRSWEVTLVSVLLRELERFEGVCILATNHRDRFDPAFERRLTMRVDFRPPTVEMSEQIWRKMLPAKLPRIADLDISALGRLGLTGGQIKNVLLNAARRAAMFGRAHIGMEELLHAAGREQPAREDPMGFAGGIAPPLRPPSAQKEAA